MSSPVTIVTDLGLPVIQLNAIPAAQILNVTSGNVANAIATATMPAVATSTNYITGFDVTGSGATVALPVVVTVAGLLGGSMTFTYVAIAGALLANTPLSIRFPSPMPASAVNIAITVTCAALGIGSTNNVVNAYGYKA